MNARACQLCGKPLSRLRVGSDGDFCSKEHRNQFRLRAGIDRLNEVNKVASLMRRRESARQIALSSLAANAAQEPRGFLESRPSQIEGAPHMVELRAAWKKPQIAAHAEHFAIHRVEPTRAAAARPRTHATVIPLAARGVRP